MRTAVVVNVAFFACCFAGCPSLDRVEQANQLPTAAAGDDQVVNAGDVVTLAGAVEDAEGDAVTVRWTQLAGSPVALASATEATTTFLAPEARGRLVFGLAGDDGFGEGVADLVFVDVGYNRVPVASAPVLVEVTAGDGVRVVGSGSDPDGDVISGYAWEVVSGPGGVDLDAMVTGADGPVPVVTPPVKGEYTLSLVVSDSFGGASLPVTTVVVAGNHAPTAVPGADVVGLNHQPVDLNGSGVDVDGDAIVGFRWRVVDFPSGGGFQLLDADSADAQIVPDGKGTYVLELVVDDGEDESPPSQLLVVAGNTPPSVTTTTTATTANLSALALQADGRDGDGDVVFYRWAVVERPAGGTFTLGGGASAEVSFTPRGKGRWVLSVTPSDGVVDGAAALVEVIAGNARPVALTQPSAAVVAGHALTLLGDGADVDGDAITGFSWRVVSGPPGADLDALVGNTSRAARFTPGVKGDWVVGLVVNDGEDDSDVVLVNVAALNNPPRASSSGVIRTQNGQAVVVDAAVVDDDGDDVSAFSWRVAAFPDGGSFTLLNDDQERATLVPRGKGAWTLELTASDGESQSAPTEVLVIAENNAPVTTTNPTAEVGNGDTLRLLAQSSDADGDDVRVAWAVVAVPAGGRAVLAGAATSEVSFTGFGKGRYRLSVTPSDGDATGAAAFVDVDVDNVAPTANAGPDQSGVTAGTVVVLDGRASVDIDGDPVTFAWTQSAGPAVALDNATLAQPRFTAPGVRTTLRFALVVNDGEKASVADEVVVVVDNIAPVAVAGADGFADAGAGLVLDGTASSDVESAGLLFRWSQTAGPPVSFSPSSTVARPTVAVPAVAGTLLRFSLVVSDGQADSAADDVAFEVIPSDVTHVFVDDNGACVVDCDGSRAKPHKTINAGAVVALSRGKPMLVAVGTYPQALLTTALDVTGGCDPLRWSCDGSAGDSILTPSTATATGLELRGNATSGAFHVQNLTVFSAAGDPASAATPVIGLRCVGCKGVVEDVTVVADGSAAEVFSRGVLVENSGGPLRLSRLDVTSGAGLNNEGLAIDASSDVVVEDSLVTTRAQIVAANNVRASSNVAVALTGATVNVLLRRNRVELNGNAAAGICRGISMLNGGAATVINNVIWDRAICAGFQDNRNPVNVGVFVGSANANFIHNTLLGNTDAFPIVGGSFGAFSASPGAIATLLTNNYIQDFRSVVVSSGAGDWLMKGNAVFGQVDVIASNIGPRGDPDVMNSGDGSRGMRVGTGNVAVDCTIVSAVNGDVHLRAGSPCIDTAFVGDPRAPVDDFEGDSRPTAGNIDRGADEVQP